MWREKQSPEVFCEKGILRNFSKFTGKHLCQSLSFNKAAGLPKFIRTRFLTENLRATTSKVYFRIKFCCFKCEIFFQFTPEIIFNYVYVLKLV